MRRKLINLSPKLDVVLSMAPTNAFAVTPSFPTTHRQDSRTSQLLAILNYGPSISRDYGIGPLSTRARVGLKKEQIVRGGPRFAPRSVGNISDSTLQHRAQWRGLFYLGCCSSQLSDIYAEHLVFCAPWTDKSTVGLLAEMFRGEYCRAFANSLDGIEPTSKVIGFLKALEKWMGIKRAQDTVIEFRERLVRAALEGLRRSVNISHGSHLRLQEADRCVG